MPTINIYHNNQEEKLNDAAKEFKPFLAEILSCKDITLSEKEISIRLIETKGSHMIGALEVEIKVHSFKERVDKQDEIANEIRDYLMKQLSDVGDIRVWLILSELGHSF